jgi:YHS domain-containing protein
MAGMFKDPVCGMEVTYETAQARSEYEERTYYFDSLECKEAFDKDPEKYVTHEEEIHR